MALGEHKEATPQQLRLIKALTEEVGAEAQRTAEPAKFLIEFLMATLQYFQLLVCRSLKRQNTPAEKFFWSYIIGRINRFAEDAAERELFVARLLESLTPSLLTWANGRREWKEFRDAREAQQA